MFELINKTDIFHLYYLFVNDIRQEKFSGLSHVIEHMCLNHSDAPPQLTGKGYTYFNHICLLFSCTSVDVLRKIDERILSGDVITLENLAHAKIQVMHEIQESGHTSELSENVISFVTDGELCKFPIGTLDDVERITVSDVKEWLANKKRSGEVYKLFFKNITNSLPYSPLTDSSIADSNPYESKLFNLSHDEFLHLTPSVKSKTICVYLRVPPIYSKSAIIKKALFEYCIQRKLNECLGFNVSIQDCYFGDKERYSVLGIPLQDSSTVDTLLMSIRQSVKQICIGDFELYRDEFKNMLSKILKEEKSNYDKINAFKNSILYNAPQVELDDIKYVNSVDYSQFPIMLIATAPLKVVIR